MVFWKNSSRSRRTLNWSLGSSKVSNDNLVRERIRRERRREGREKFLGGEVKRNAECINLMILSPFNLILELCETARFCVACCKGFI